MKFPPETQLTQSTSTPRCNSLRRTPEERAADRIPPPENASPIFASFGSFGVVFPWESGDWKTGRTNECLWSIKRLLAAPQDDSFSISKVGHQGHTVPLQKITELEETKGRLSRWSCYFNIVLLYAMVCLEFSFFSFSCRNWMSRRRLMDQDDSNLYLHPRLCTLRKLVYNRGRVCCQGIGLTSPLSFAVM